MFEKRYIQARLDCSAHSLKIISCVIQKCAELSLHRNHLILVQIIVKHFLQPVSSQQMCAGEKENISVKIGLKHKETVASCE